MRSAETYGWVPLARLADFAVAAASCCLRLHGSFHFQLDTELDQPERMQIPQILVSCRHYLIASRLAAAICKSPLPYRLKVGCSGMQVTTTRCPDIDSGGTALFINRWDPLILSFIYEFVLLVKALPRDFSSSPTAKPTGLSFHSLHCCPFVSRLV